MAGDIRVYGEVFCIFPPLGRKSLEAIPKLVPNIPRRPCWSRRKQLHGNKTAPELLEFNPQPSVFPINQVHLSVNGALTQVAIERGHEFLPRIILRDSPDWCVLLNGAAIVMIQRTLVHNVPNDLRQI
jgi:hypothetical protein